MEVLTELGEIVDDLEVNAPAGLVLQSAKPGSFIVGADVREFDGYDDAEMASDGIDKVHRLFNRIEALPFQQTQNVDLRSAIDFEGFPQNPPHLKGVSKPLDSYRAAAIGERLLHRST